jgi:CBS-domain-containing membrane protein
MQVGCFFATVVSITFVGIVSDRIGVTQVMPAVGATAVFVIAAPESQQTKPWNVVVGWFIGLVSGLSLRYFFHGATWMGGLLAAIASVAISVAVSAVHPPAWAAAFLLAFEDADYFC